MLSLLLSAVLSQGQPVLIADPKNLSKRATISTSADGGQGALNVHVVPSDTALTAFGETRVSTPYTLFDMGSGRYGRDSREVSSIAGDGGTVTDVLRSSGFTLSVPGGNTAYARARTNTWFRYQAGRGQLVTLSATQDDCPAGQIRRWGYFDEHDGLYYQVSGGTLSVVRRTSTAESASCTGCHQTDGGTKTLYEQVVTQANWNVNTYPSLDWRKGNIWQIEFQWLGVGVVSFYVNGTLVHRMNHPNALAYPYMRSATLPLSWEVVNTGAADAGSLTAICANVTSQSGSTPPQYGYAYARAAVNVTTADIPLLSLRSTTLLGGADNHITILPKSVHIEHPETTGNTTATVSIWFNPTLTNATWTVVPNNGSGAELDIGATAQTGGVLLSRYTVAGGTGNTLDLSPLFGEVARKLRRSAFTGTSDILTVSVIISNGTHAITPELQWTEIK